MSYSLDVRLPAVSLAIEPSAIDAGPCETQKVIEATLAFCWQPANEEPVTFTTSTGTFFESNSTEVTVETDSSGIATATLARPAGCDTETAIVSVSHPWQQGSGAIVSWHTWQMEIVSDDWVVSGNAIPVKARLTLEDGTTVVPSQQVVLTTDLGSFDPHDSGNLQQYTALTNPVGEIATMLTVTGCPVNATLNASASCNGSTCPVEDNKEVLAICSENEVRDLAIVLDVTGSMRIGGLGENKAKQGLSSLLYSLKADGIPVRAVGVRFTNEVDTTSNLNLTSDYDEVATWLSKTNEADDGGDTFENPLDALTAAATLLPGCFIALATDAGYHHAGDSGEPYPTIDHPGSPCPYTQLTEQSVRASLALANCRVYIDAGPDTAVIDLYSASLLYVNGAMEIPATEHFRFPRLETELRK